ncbi:hypothetical protein PtA15_7A254 [Puccinia triticina]|uniref:Uncharacterized protein n=1 Tax=Puccinia triticina TaxID=208348 RepID=A0ABY7CMR9_9BASI|nr:uncharacterized protein PtA15_7A254 [Puccinia triticina]WAQ86528.1 hypothetical protein PtA15_7A254 [Puccinia triticina]
MTVYIPRANIHLQAGPDDEPMLDAKCPFTQFSIRGGLLQKRSTASPPPPLSTPTAPISILTSITLESILILIILPICSTNILPASFLYPLISPPALTPPGARSASCLLSTNRCY